jgi:hypothetical protein
MMKTSFVIAILACAAITPIASADITQIVGRLVQRFDNEIRCAASERIAPSERGCWACFMTKLKQTGARFPDSDAESSEMRKALIAAIQTNFKACLDRVPTPVAAMP